MSGLPVEKMVDDFWRVHMMIVAARDPIRESEPEAYPKIQEVLAITAKWLE